MKFPLGDSAVSAAEVLPLLFLAFKRLQALKYSLWNGVLVFSVFPSAAAGCARDYSAASNQDEQGKQRPDGSADDDVTPRQANGEICLTHGLRVLDECELRIKKKRMDTVCVGLRFADGSMDFY